MVGLFSGPWIALGRPIQFFHAKLVIAIVSGVGQSMSPALIVLIPMKVLSTIALVIESRGGDQIAWSFNAAGFVRTILSLFIAVVFEVPVVDEITGWASSSTPENGKQRRDHWIVMHRIRVFAEVGSLLSLVVALSFRSR